MSARDLGLGTGACCDALIGLNLTLVEVQPPYGNFLGEAERVSDRWPHIIADSPLLLRDNMTTESVLLWQQVQCNPSSEADLYAHSSHQTAVKVDISATGFAAGTTTLLWRPDRLDVIEHWHTSSKHRRTWITQYQLEVRSIVPVLESECAHNLHLLSQAYPGAVCIELVVQPCCVLNVWTHVERLPTCTVERCQLPCSCIAETCDAARPKSGHVQPCYVQVHT